MIQKGIFLLVLFFGLSILLTLGLSVIMNPDGFVFWAFLYIFSTSQLFLFLHSLLYWYYTTKKYVDEYPVDKRSPEFDKKTLVIISAFSEDNDVLEPTFDAVKQSFHGPVMLAVDAPKNVKSYIELCKNHDIICLHRIHRSGYKAGAINNVVLNFLKYQHGYIKKTRRDLADELVLNVNDSSELLPFQLPDDLKTIKSKLILVDKKISSFSSDHIYQHISNLVSGNQTKYLSPQDLDTLHSRINSLAEKIDDVIEYYHLSYATLSALSKIVSPVNRGMEKLSSDIEYLQLETESTFKQLTSIQLIQSILKTEYCIENLNILNSKRIAEFSDKKETLFSTVSSIGNALDDIYAFTELEKKNLASNSDDSITDDQIQINHNHLKKLQNNLRAVSNMLILLNKTLDSSASHYIYEHISDLTSGKQTNHLLPKDLESLSAAIQTQRSKLRDIDDDIESLYEENLYENMDSVLGEDSKNPNLGDFNLLQSKIQDLEKNLPTLAEESNSSTSTDLESLSAAIQTQRSKLRDIDDDIESLYEENLYENMDSVLGEDSKNPNLGDFNLLQSKIQDLGHDVDELYDLTKSVDLINFIPDLNETFMAIKDNVFHQTQFSFSDDVQKKLGKIEDLISEFNYTVKDLAQILPLDIEYIVLLDSDAHPKFDSDPQNNFFDLAARHIEENDLLVFPQFYDKEGGNLVRAAYAQQVPFMKTIMPKRGDDNTAFMLGTNIMVKKNTLESVGGFDDSTVTEDLATTIKMHESDAKSKYINKDVVSNGAPFSIGGYFTQQQRWAYGTYQVFFAMLLQGIGNDLKLKSYVEYLYGNTWYFYGLTFLINALIPFYSIFLEGLIQIPEDLFFILYLPYVFSGIVIFFYSVLRTGHGLKDVFYNMSLNAICFFIYIKALFFIITRKSLPFEVTPKSGSSEETILRFKKILPILVVIGLLGFSLTIYAIRIVTGETSVVAGLINILWCSLFISLLSPVLSFK